MIKKIKTTEELLKSIEKYETAKDLIEKLDIVIVEDKNNIKSKQGIIYEKLWDICIKFGLVKSIISFDNNNKLLHLNRNINETEKLKKEHFQSFSDFFDNYLKDNFNSGNKSGYSDITFRNNKEIVISSSKYYEKDDETDIKKYDILNLCPFLEKNGNENIKIILFIKNKEKFLKKRKTDNKSSLILTNYINPHGKYENVYDLNDLEFYFIELKKILKYYNYFKDENLLKFKNEYLFKFKNVFMPKFHQSLYINQIDKIINKKSDKKDDKNILIGAIPRTGKTFILGGIIKKYLEKNVNKNNNFLLITPAPTETIPQYKELFENYLDFNELELIDKTYINNTKKTKNNSLYIFSKQTLDKQNDKVKINETNNILKILEKTNFDIIFIDEAHYGMTTEKSEKILNKLKTLDTWRIFITATYNKPILKFNIQEKNKLFWSLEDVIKLKRIAVNTDKYKQIIDFKDFYDKYVIKGQRRFNKNIIDNVLEYDYNINLNDLFNSYDRLLILLNQYKDFPEPYLLTTIWNNIDEIYNEIRKANGLDTHTFTLDNLFDLKTNKEFKNKEELIELFHYFYGYPRKTLNKINNIKYDIRNKYKLNGIIPRITNICENKCRTLQEIPNDFNITTQLWFLPTNQDKLINKIPALLKLLSENFNYIFNQTLFLVATSDTIDENKQIKYNNVKYNIKNKDDIKLHEINNKSDKKFKNIVILTGEKFTLGISLPSVDIVVLFNDSTSYDLLYQMMFRSMTEVINNKDCIQNSYCDKKRYGFIVDLNPQRTFLLTNYIKNNIIKNKSNDNNDELEDNIKTLDLLNIDRDKYTIKFGNDYDDKNEAYEKQKEFALKYLEYESKINNKYSFAIFNQLKNLKLEFDLKFLNSVRDIIKNFKFNEETNKIIYKEGMDEKFRRKIRNEIKKQNPKISDDELNKKEKEILDDNTKLLGIFSEFIPILSILTGIDKKCVFNANNINDFKINLKHNLDIIYNDYQLQLREIFVEFIDDRCNLNIDIKKDKYEEYYNFFNNLIKTLPSKSISSKSISSKSDNKIITKEHCKKWLENNKLKNPLTNKKIKEGGIIYKNLEKACIKKNIKGGNNEYTEKIEKIIGDLKKEIYTINNPTELLEFINRYLKPTEKKKKENGEVFTPIKLIEEMMNKLEEAEPNIFKNKNLKWLDPAAGMGNFPVVVYLRLMIGLSYIIKDEEERRKWILEEMLYMVEYDKTNVFMMKKIFCGDKYKLNIFHGSFIDEDRYKEEGVDIFSLDYKEIKKEENKKFVKKINKFKGMFDIIMGNPPFQKNSLKNSSPIWNLFIDKSFYFLKKIIGFLLFINPSGWRDISGKFDNIKKEIFNRNLIYLEIHNEKDGLKTFSSNTRYDIILIKNENVKETNTKILFEDNEIKIINVKELLFIPNGNYDFIRQLIAKNNEKKINFLYDSCSYHTQKEWVFRDKTKKYKYPCVLSVNIKDEPRICYSSIKYIDDIHKQINKCNNSNIEHYNKSKIIWGNGATGYFIDTNGDYALTEYSYAILHKDINILKKIKEALKTNKFKEIIKYTSVKKQSINRRIIKLFKEDFYKYFIN